MGQIIKGLFGGGDKQAKAARQQQAIESANNQKVQEIGQAQQLQVQGQQSAELDKSLTATRKSGLGRRLLIDTGAGKSTIG